MMEHWASSEGMFIGYIYRPVHSKRRVGPIDSSLKLGRSGGHSVSLA